VHRIAVAEGGTPSSLARSRLRRRRLLVRNVATLADPYQSDAVLADRLDAQLVPVHVDLVAALGEPSEVAEEESPIEL
jgi:hypothetical protein